MQNYYKGRQLGIDTEDMEKCFLRTENPIALLRGDRLVRDYHLHTRTKICYGDIAKDG